MTLKSIALRGTFDVELVDVAGSDDAICHAARVSTLGQDVWDTAESEGLITKLLQHRRGTPFEHGMMTFRISAPIFVWREFIPHRFVFSYNEQENRHMTMLPIFYLPTPDRPLQETNDQKLLKGSSYQYDLTVEELKHSYAACWSSYTNMLEVGVAREVARMVLPVSTFSSAYITCSPRALMSFLELQTINNKITEFSDPQWEINWVAEQMETQFARSFPITHKVFNENGRVSP